MKKSVCHYSFHRTWKEENWDCRKLCEEVKSAGADAVDFHAGLVGSASGAAAVITAALDATGLEISGVSMSNNFNTTDPDEFRKQIDTVKAWLPVAAQVKSPVSRIFGGHIKDRSNPQEIQKGLDRILPAIEEVLTEAEKHGIILALENHGGLPCTGEEQAQVIERFNSPYLRATIDVGNYMQGGQEGHDGTAIAAKYAAYVHFKDNKKTGSGKHEACTVGKGDVDHLRCLELLRDAGFNGYVALEYEGPDEERKGVSESLAFMNSVMEGF